MGAQWVPQCHLHTEYFAREALSSYPNPPDCWHRYVDDTFSKLHEYEVEGSTEHLNPRDPNIKFAMEPASDGTLAFLHACVY